MVPQADPASSNSSFLYCQFGEVEEQQHGWFENEGRLNLRLYV